MLRYHSGMSLQADNRKVLSPTNVTVQSTLPSGNPREGKTVRRIEILVERTVCSVEIHGSAQLRAGRYCPICGQEVPAAKQTGNEEVLSERAAKESGEGDVNNTMGSSTNSSSTNKGSDQGELL